MELPYTRPQGLREGATMVMVADSGRARLFQLMREDGELEELTALLDPDARLQAHEAQADRAGRSVVGQSFAPREDYAHHHAEAFAHALAGYLRAAREAGDLSVLHLIAEPRFLGLLRPRLDAATRRLVASEKSADLSRHPVDAIRAHLPARL